jgi:two-component system response regulator YesN
MAQTTAMVLIVDDELDMRLLVRAILQTSSLGVEVVAEAADGLEAMAVFATLDPPDVPDVVILDNRMPGMDGLQVAAAMLKQEPRQRIVLFSAFVTDDMEKEAASLGVRACIGKHDFAHLPQLVADLSAS